MSRISLYDINKMYWECLELAVNKEGEIVDEELFKLLGEISENKETKILNIACLLKSILAEADAYKNEMDNIAKKRKSAINKAESLKKWLSNIVNEGEKIKDARASISWRKSEITEILCEPENLPIMYQRIKIDANLTDIKRDLRDGFKIANCKLIEKQNIQIK